MKVLVFSTLVAAALCAAPAPPPGWTPSGRLLLVPARLEAYPPPAEYPQTNSTGVTQDSESDESQSEKLLESGEYYVLLPDGRLQMVKYATAALKAEEEESEDTKESQDNQSVQSNGVDQQKYQPAAYYIQAQEQQSSQYKTQQPATYYSQAQEQQQSSQYNTQQPATYYSQAQDQQQSSQYKTQQPAAYYIQAQAEQNEQSAQYNSQGPLKFQQKFQPAAYPVFIRPVEQPESAQYKNAEPQYPNQKSSDSKFQQVKQEPSNSQIELVQFPLEGSQQFYQTKLQLSEPKSAQVKAEGDEEASGFEAKVQYRDVKPISAPIFAYNPTPLVRILKK